MKKYCCLSSACKVEHNDIPNSESDRFREKGDRLVHPAYFARYGWKSIDDLEQCLKKMGFWKVVDAAEGAAMMKEKIYTVSEEPAAEEMRISSNCPVVVRLIEKKYPHLTEHLMPVYSIKQMHAVISQESSIRMLFWYTSVRVSQ